MLAEKKKVPPAAPTARVLYDYRHLPSLTRETQEGIKCAPLRAQTFKSRLVAQHGAIEVPGTYETEYQRVVPFFLRRTELQELCEPRACLCCRISCVWKEKGSLRSHDGKRALHESFHRASALHTNSSYGRIAHRSRTHGATWTLQAVSECMRGREMGHVGMLQLFLLVMHASQRRYKTHER